MRGVPTWKDVRNMEDKEIVKLMLRQMACPKCKRSSGLEPIEVGVLGANEAEGLRRVGAVIHCPTCGVIPSKMSVDVPTTAEAYVKIFALGQAGTYAIRKMAFKPITTKLKTGRSILKKFGIEHLAD